MMDLSVVYDKLYRYCFYRVRNTAAAEDITQEAFLKFYGQKQEVGSDADMAYLYTIAKHLCVDYFRRKQPVELPESAPTTDFAAQSDLSLTLEAALGKLSEDKREIIVLRYIGGLSVGAVAAHTGRSRFALYRMERAALAELKKYLKGV